MKRDTFTGQIEQRLLLLLRLLLRASRQGMKVPPAKRQRSSGSRWQQDTLNDSLYDAPAFECSPGKTS